MRRLSAGIAFGVAAAIAAAIAPSTWADGNPITPVGSQVSNAYEQLQQNSGLAPLAAGLTQPFLQGAENNNDPPRYGHFSAPFAEPTIDGVKTTQKCLEHQADANGLMFDC